MSVKEPTAIVVMGVSGAGKTSVGELLAKRLNCTFLEGDQLHPPANIKKMAEGIPLDDDDRWPWLDLIGQELTSALKRGGDVVATCSSLKKIYRDRLRQASGGVLYFVFLTGKNEVLEERMGARTGHFMPKSLLQSQLATLESPQGEAGVVTVDIDATLDEIVDEALRKLSELWGG